MSRDEMNSALKARFVPALRQLGFKGSLPHFRRQRDRRWAATIILAGALTQVFCYRARLVASSILLPVRRLAGAT
ncbi:DUF4304 domain-containing protein, partial [Paraburkholderia caledonica]|uniref:DUF4304 domain-containing protein n=1 Tax=Paraburkholderia caledonica TaxID=134536 RepID=UPI003709873F